eukprot:2422889-Pleurochrysis_carterae.AAC.1
MKSYFCGQLRAMLTGFMTCATPSKPFKLLTPQQLVQVDYYAPVPASQDPSTSSNTTAQSSPTSATTNVAGTV